MLQHLANTHDLLVCEHGAFRPSSHGWNPKQANFKALACIQLERPVQQYVAPYCFPTSTVASGKSMPHCLSKNEPLFQPPAREIRVVVANDHPVAREGLSSTLRSLECIMNLHCSQTLRRGGGAMGLVPRSFGWLRSNPFGAGKKGVGPLIAARSTEG